MWRKSGGVSHAETGIYPGTVPEEESVVDDVVQRRALLRVGCEYLLHEFTHVERVLPVGWELVLIIADVPTNAHLRLEHTKEFARELTDTPPP